MTSLDTLRNLEEDQILSGDDIFEAISEASSIVRSERYEDKDALEIAIRLLDASEKGQVPFGSHDAIEHLAEACGLFPYIDADGLNPLRAMAMEAFAVHLNKKVYLHAKQMEVLSHLLSGDNIALSAPTSFGKSLIVDAFISEKRPNCVCAIVPTIALIDETRRRLEKTFGKEYQIISKQSDTRHYKKVIYVLTQERFLNRDDFEGIDFLFVDEFYKLDPHREDHRFQTLNVALYRALRMTTQFFLAGPNIAFLNVGPSWKERLVFLRSGYQTVTVNTVDRTAEKEKFECFLSDLNGASDQQSLVYSKSPPAMRRLVQELLDEKFRAGSEIADELSAWVRENYHDQWILADACEAGIGMHHGKIPRAVAQLFVELFNEGTLPILLCTSTLIEGVNTSAENVFVYDKEISTKPFDFFSFSNIRGRVGRMMQHFVGNVFLYYSPPQEDELTVDVPVLSDPDQTDEYILMNYEPSELGPVGLERQQSLPLEYDLSPETLKKFGHFGAEVLSGAKANLRKHLKAKRHRFEWSGHPGYNQRLMLAEVIRPLLQSKNDKTTRLSVKQMAWAWDMLLKKPTLADFLSWFQEVFSKDEIQEGIERSFEFLGACEFNHATAVAAINQLLREIDPSIDADYAFFVLELESWFRPRWVKEIDEVGIPVPLSERLLPMLGQPSHYTEALVRIADLPEKELLAFSEIDQRLIKRATASLQYRM